MHATAKQNCDATPRPQYRGDAPKLPVRRQQATKSARRDCALLAWKTAIRIEKGPVHRLPLTALRELSTDNLQRRFAGPANSTDHTNRGIYKPVRLTLQPLS